MSRIIGKDDLVYKAEFEEKLWELGGYVSHYLRTFGLKDGILEDAVQETMINAWVHMDQLRDESRIKWWVRSIAKNVGLKYLRKINQKRSRELSLEAVMGSAACEEDEERLAKKLYGCMENMELEYVGQLLCCLTEREKNVILLHYAFMHPLDEVARIVGETYVNTRKISSRAIKKMREYAAKEGKREKQK